MSHMSSKAVDVDGNDVDDDAECEDDVDEDAFEDENAEAAD